MITFLKILFATSFILVVAIICLPIFIDKEKVVSKIEETLIDQYKINITFDKDIELNFLPYPKIKIKKIYFFDNNVGLKVKAKKINLSSSWRSIVNFKPEIKSLEVISPEITFKNTKKITKNNLKNFVGLQPNDNYKKFKDILKNFELLKFKNGTIFFNNKKNYTITNFDLIFKGGKLIISKGSFEINKLNSQIIFDLVENKEDMFNFIIQQKLNNKNKVDYKGRLSFYDNNLLVDGDVRSDVLNLSEFLIITNQISLLKNNKIRKVKNFEIKQSINLNFIIKSLSYKNFVFDDTNFKIFMNGKKVNISKLETNFLQSKILSDSLYLIDEKTYSGEILLKNFLIKREYFGKSKIDLYDGFSDCQINYFMSFKNKSFNNILKSINSNGNCKIGKIRLSGINFSEIASKVDEVEDFQSLVKLISSKNLGTESMLDNTNIKFSTKSGIVNIESINSLHKNLKFSSHGKYKILEDRISLKSKAYFMTKKFKTLPPLGINIEGTSDSYDLSYDFENLKEKLFNESINKILKKKKSIILDPKKIKKLIDKNIQKELDAGKIIDMFLN
ncbi:MAG: AsmA family protein [Alphaproteobacteria bacterium]